MPSEDYTTKVPLIDINGQPFSEAMMDSLVYLRVDRAAGTPAMVQMLFDDVELAGSKFPIAAKIEVSVPPMSTGAAVKVFTGTVVSVGVDFDMSRRDCVIEAVDASFALGQTMLLQSTVNKSYTDIVGDIAAEAKLSPQCDARLAAAFATRQLTGTPHQVLSRIAHETGCEWFVDDTKLVVRPRKSGAAVKLDANTVQQLRLRFSSSEFADSVEVRGWDNVEKKALVGSKKGPVTKDKQNVPIVKNNWSKLGTPSAVSVDSVVLTVKEAETQAEGILERMESSLITGRGEVLVNPAIVPGAVLEIEEVSPDWNGKYYTTGVEHVFGRGQSFTTRFTIGPLESSALVDVLGSDSGSAHTGRIAGAVIGIVSDIKDEEGLGRVKVNLPHISDEAVTGWATVVQLGAGDKRGLMVMPEIDDSVVVLFEHGDINRPLIIGGIWNKKDKPPVSFDDSGKNDRRSFTSRDGHELIFSDNTDELQILLQHKDGKTKLLLDKEKIELHANDTPIEVKTKDATITLKDGNVDIAANNINLKAKQKVTIEGNAGVEIKSGATMKIESKAPLDIKGTKVAIDGGPMTEVKGAIVKVN